MSPKVGKTDQNNSEHGYFLCSKNSRYLVRTEEIRHKALGISTFSITNILKIWAKFSRMYAID